MTEQGRPTGIKYEDADDVARRGGTVDFEGRRAGVVRLNVESNMSRQHTALLALDLGDEHLVLFGYFSGEDEFMEMGRKRPS
jgi:hypothetical protein